MNKLTFNEFKELMEKANIENKQIYGIIVFKPESFEKDFSEEERSYKVSSQANYFDSRKIGKSLFGDSLDGSDTNVRLDWYMNALPEDKLGSRWVVDYCYLLNEDKYEKTESINNNNIKQEFDINNDPGFKEYVKTLLEDGVIDDPEYVNKLSDEEFEDLLTNTWMKDPEIIDIYKSLNESKELEESVKIDDVKDIKDRKFFSIMFQLDKLRIFEVNYVMKNIYRGSIGKDRSKFEPIKVVDEFSTSADLLQRGKRDIKSGGQTQEEILVNYPTAKKFYEKWDHVHLHSLTEEEYNEMLNDLEQLKDTYNFIEKVENVVDRYGFNFSEKVELSKMKPKNKIGESLEESQARDAADAINSSEWYNNDKRKQTFEGMLADKIAEKAEELGDDYSEWLDQNTIEKMIEDLKNCEEVKTFYNTLDRLIEMYIEERVDWIRRDEPASRYYGREDLDESKKNLDESKKEEDYHGMYNNTYRGEDFQELAEMYGYGEISEEDLAEELLRLYTTIEGAKAAYNEITGKDMKEYSYEELIQINNKPEEDLDDTEDLLEESNEPKNEDYTQASNAGAIKVDIIGQPKKKSKKDKEDPALKSLPVQQVLIEDKDYRSADEIYNDLSNLKDDE